MYTRAHTSRTPLPRRSKQRTRERRFDVISTHFRTVPVCCRVLAPSSVRSADGQTSRSRNRLREKRFSTYFTSVRAKTRPLSFSSQYDDILTARNAFRFRSCINTSHLFHGGFFDVSPNLSAYPSNIRANINNNGPSIGNSNEKDSRLIIISDPPS